MIRVDEADPVGEVQLSFPHRDVQIQRNVEPKDVYDIETEIGRGKFGTVFKCKDKTTGLLLAAKFVPVSKKEDRRNVEREISIMKSLQHPRLLQIYDAFENSKTMCVILELIEGGELFERVIDDDFVLTEKSCTAFMRQICEGIDFIHKQRILHLDMKPENILCLTKTGNRIKIIDFGLARRYDPDKKLQVLFGTPEFVAPEVVNFDDISYGTDMWSVGVICYVLLSGLSPFMGHSDVETMANVTIGKYDFDDEAFQDISANAKEFISKLLIKDINSRMSAEQCLNHPWLARRAPSTALNMGVTKDNLRQFVERWNEHPNSPYVFELSSHAIIPSSASGILRSDSLHSLVGLSPSPCGSLASSVSSDDEIPPYRGPTSNLQVPQLDQLRRASDSTTCVTKRTDVAERVNLADEIRKLTDKLFQLSELPPLPRPKTELQSTIIKQDYVEKSFTMPRKKLGQFNQKIIRDQFLTDRPKSPPQFGVPWRRQKFRVTNLSRDVPLGPKTSFSSFSEQFQSEISSFSYKSSMASPKTQHGNMENTVNGTKNMLLKLLEQWDGPQMPTRINQRHCSDASELSEHNSIGQQTISSLNTFFQSRAKNKKIHPFLNTNGYK